MSESWLVNDELLSAYLDGELSGEDRARIEQMLASSELVRQQLADYQLLSRFVREQPTVELPSQFANKIALSIEQRRGALTSHAVSSLAPGEEGQLGRDTVVNGTRLRSRGFWRRWKVIRWSSGGLVAVLLVGVAFWSTEQTARDSHSRLADGEQASESWPVESMQDVSVQKSQRPPMQMPESESLAEMRDLRASDTYRNPTVPRTVPPGAAFANNSPAPVDGLTHNPRAMETAKPSPALADTVVTRNDRLGPVTAVPSGPRPRGSWLEGLASVDNNYSQLSKDLKDQLRVGEVIVYLEQNESDVVVVKATVVDVRQAMDTLQVLLSRNAVPVLNQQPAFNMFAASNIHNRIDEFAVYAEGTPSQIVATLAELKESDLFVDVEPAGVLNDQETHSLVASNALQFSQSEYALPEALHAPRNSSVGAAATASKIAELDRQKRDRSVPASNARCASATIRCRSVCRCQVRQCQIFGC